MTTDTRYNGWTNYETWCVNLWIDNIEGSQQEWAWHAQEALDEAEGNREHATRDIAARLQAEVEENNPLADHANMYADMLASAIRATNWREIALSLLEDLTYEAEED